MAPDRCFHYLGLQLPIAFTGGLLLADELVPELAVHMGFAPAWKYRFVHELILEAGRIVSTIDLSERMRWLRDHPGRVSLGPEDPDDRQSVESWTARSFSRAYDLTSMTAAPPPGPTVDQSLRLVSAGPNRLQVLSLVRHLLDLSPSQVRRLLASGETELTRAPSYAVADLRRKLEALGATVRVENEKPSKNS